MTINWDQLREDVLEPSELKERLPLEYVVEREGVALSVRGDQLVGLCPFHDDHEPSFSLWGEDLTRWGCFPCGVSGDLFDFLRLTTRGEFRDALARAQEHWREFRALERWEPTRIEQRPTCSPEDLATDVVAARRRVDADRQAIARLVAAKDLPTSLEWLVREFRLGILDDVTTVAPYYDENDNVLGYKTRQPRMHWLAAIGTRLSELYGVWRDRRQSVVILCEGETDTWKAAYELRDRDVLVLGLPAGAGQRVRPEWLERLRDRHVYLAFDGDRAGDNATLRWAGALLNGTEDRPGRVATAIYRVPLEDGQDLLDAESTSRLLADAIAITDPPANLQEQRGYWFIGPRSRRVLSDWSLRLTRYLAGDDPTWVGYLPNLREVAISASDLETSGSLVRWSARHGFTWVGKQGDHHLLAQYLRHQAPFLRFGKMSRTVGLHEDHFVLPDRVLGPRYWKYVPRIDVGLQQKIRVESGEWSPRTLAAFLSLWPPEVMSPIAAWMAAAPVRSLVEAFPVLAIVGSAGVGKSTLAQKAMQLFWGWDSAILLSNTTPHAIYSFASATNGVPIWFDEFRRGIRRDAREAIDQAIRSAWTGDDISKGGLDRTNYQIVTSFPVTAPLLITGEDAFVETSHVERTAVVVLRYAERNADTLRVLSSLETGGFGYAYLSWLRAQVVDGLLPVLDQQRSDRSEVVWATLEWGWELLSRFAREACGYDLPELDLSLVRREVTEAVSPVIEALGWAVGKYNRDDLSPIVWYDHSDVLVRAHDFVNLCRNSDIVLPGGRKAVKMILRDTFSSRNERTPHGLALRLLGARETVENSELSEETTVATTI